MAESARSIRIESETRPVEREEGGLHGEPYYNIVPLRQAYNVLRFGFTVAPLVAGIDKFFHLLVNWDQYLAPIVPRELGINGHTFMQGIGVIEIIAGVGVAIKPKIFSYVVSGWLIGIVGNLLLTGEYFDIALRDFGLALGAFSLGRLSQWFDRNKTLAEK